MINLVKSQPPPSSLAIEKEKKSGTYRTEEVINRIHADFFNKCYICEASEITSINVEHFEPIKGNRNLEFNWNNLFFVCGHCNNTKLAKSDYDGMLNCTNPDQRVADWISYRFEEGESFSKIKVVIEEAEPHSGVQPTIALLRDVYNGKHTFIKTIECDNLRKQLQKELALFTEGLLKFYTETNAPLRETACQEVITHLQKPSAFSAFKIWIIRSKQTYLNDFGAHIPA